MTIVAFTNGAAGMSLSLAAGAVTVASASAGRGVSGICNDDSESVFGVEDFGNGGRAAATALELAHQGAKAMWLATLMKTTAAVSGLFVAAGIAWGVQGGRGLGDGSAAARSGGQVEVTAVHEHVKRGGSSWSH